MGQEIKFQDGESYEKWMGVWTQLVGDQFLDWLSPETAKAWLDIGCGNGAFTEQIYQHTMILPKFTPLIHLLSKLILHQDALSPTGCHSRWGTQWI